MAPLGLPAVLARPDDREAVVDTVCAAFIDDPAFRYFFADPDRFEDEARIFVSYLFDKRVGLNTIWMTPGAEAVAMWSPPSSPGETGSGDSGYAAVMDRLGEAGERIHRYDAPVEAVLPTSYWYLGILATHPDHRGRKLGRDTMIRGVEAAAASGQPAFLETTNPANVAVYQSAGWEVHDELDVGSLHIWVFRHRP